MAVARRCCGAWIEDEIIGAERRAEANDSAEFASDWPRHSRPDPEEYVRTELERAGGKLGDQER